jgi:hypothetical protein
MASVEAAEPIREDADTPPAPVAYQGGPVEFDRVVPASGNLAVRGKQFWLGPTRAWVTVTFWADHDVIHLSIAGARVKTVRSHLSTTDLAALATTGGHPADPSPLPPTQPGAVLEVDRTVSQGGLVSLGAYRLLAAEILSGRRVSIRIETTTLMFFDPDTRELLRARPNPLSYDQARKLRGARPAGPPPRPSLEPVTVQRRPSATGVILVAGQKLALGRTHAHTGVTVHVAEHTMTVEFPDGAQRTFTAPPLSPSAAGRPTDPAHPTPMTNRPRAHDPPGHHRPSGAVCRPAPPASRVLRIADATASGGPGPWSHYRPCARINQGQATVVEVRRTLWGVARDGARLAAPLPPGGPGLADGRTACITTGGSWPPRSKHECDPLTHDRTPEETNAHR